MAYKHKLRVSHLQDDLDKGYIKSKEEYKAALEQLDKEGLIEYFLEEFETMKQEEDTKSDGDLDEDGTNAEF